jgi:hypothetical protein
LTDPEITKIITGSGKDTPCRYIVMRGNKTIGGPFNSWRLALEWIDSQKPKRGRAAADLDAQNT